MCCAMVFIKYVGYQLYDEETDKNKLDGEQSADVSGGIC